MQQLELMGSASAWAVGFSNGLNIDDKSLLTLPHIADLQKGEEGNNFTFGFDRQGMELPANALLFRDLPSRLFF